MIEFLFFIKVASLFTCFFLLIIFWYVVCMVLEEKYDLNKAFANCLAISLPLGSITYAIYHSEYILSFFDKIAH